jgi:lipid-A-disaccharide synthase
VRQGLAERFVLPVAPGVSIDGSALGGLPIERVEGDAVTRRRAIARSSAALVASGTATLETALVGRPQVIFYKMNWLTWWIGKPFVKVHHLGLPNLIAGREVAPELLQGRFTKAALVAAVRPMLEGGRPAIDRARAVADELRDRLGSSGASGRAAKAVLELLSGDQPTRFKNSPPSGGRSSTSD